MTMSDVAPAELELPERWHSPVAVPLGVMSSDGRQFDAPFRPRETPFPLMLMRTGTHGEGTPEASVVAGTVDRVEVHADRVEAWGTFDLGSSEGREAARLVAEGVMTHVSIDGEISMDDTIVDVEERTDSNGMTWLATTFTNAGMAGLTIVPMPAFPQARIEPDNDMAIVAAAGSLPPREWFDDPRLERPTPLTVTADGRVFGHIADFQGCHIGQTEVCVTPPRSQTAYAYFLTGEVECADGARVRTGPLTVGTGHASLAHGHAATAAHYDNTGHAVADVTVGEDQFGPWCAGAIRPSASPEQVQALRASAPSGDWRRIGGNLELVAVLMVNTPGFPIPRAVAASAEVVEEGNMRARQHDGECLALVAAARVLPPTDGERIAALEATVAELRGELVALRGLRPVAIAALRDRIVV